MSVPSLKRIFVSRCGGEFLGTEHYGNNFVLAAGVPKFYTVPTGAIKAIFAALGDFWIRYFTATDPVDIVTNGAMASDTGWTKGTGVTIAANVMSFDGTQDASNGLTVQTPPANYLVNGESYYTSIVVTRSAGSIALLMGGTAGTSRALNGTYTEVITAGAGTTIGFQPDADFVGTVTTYTANPCAFQSTTDNIGVGSFLNPTNRHFDDFTRFSLYSKDGTTGVISYFLSE